MFYSNFNQSLSFHLVIIPLSKYYQTDSQNIPLNESYIKLNLDIDIIYKYYEYRFDDSMNEYVDDFLVAALIPARN